MTTIQPISSKYAVAVILTDSNRIIQWVNDDFTQITGYSLMEVIGKSPSLLQGRNTKKETISRIRRKLQELKPFKEEVINYRKNGQEYPCRFIIHPIFDSFHHLINFIAFEVDGSIVKDDSVISLMQLKPKYNSSSLSDLEELGIYTKLLALVEAEKLYLDPNLKLKYLADRLNTNTRYLSQVINHQTEHNLIHFINHYRIKEIKEKLLDENYKYLTAFGLAQQCGFKNKSTFYKVFKEITDMTPNDFIKEHNLLGKFEEYDV